MATPPGADANDHSAVQLGCAGKKHDADDHPITSACVRFFKYLLVDYSEEFSARLRAHVINALVLVPMPTAETVAASQRWRNLQSLYGRHQVLPDSLLEVLNGDAARLQHVGRPSGSEEEVAAWLSSELERWCLRAEEKPVVTRFWLFSSCIYSLFRWKLLDLPVQVILQTGAVVVRKMFSDRSSRSHDVLRMAPWLREMVSL